jgi:hypothetical protein
MDVMMPPWRLALFSAAVIVVIEDLSAIIFVGI